MSIPTSIEPSTPAVPPGAVPLEAVHTRERQFTRIFTTMYGQKHRARTQLPVKTQAVRMHEAGGPEVLQVENLWVPDPGATEVRVAQKAIGLNFLDTYQRRGAFPSPGLPWVLGFEGAGVVEAVGGAVTAFKEGDRVAYASTPPGAYAGLRTVAADALVTLPDAIGFEQAAATVLKGMTAEYLVQKSGAVQPGDTVLVHAAAGGTGLLLCQWLAHAGATVIGCAGSDEKCALAEAHGCRHAIDYRREDVAARVAELTGSEGGGRGLRFRRPGHRRGLRRLPWARRHAGALRQLVGRPGAERAYRSGGEVTKGRAPRPLRRERHAGGAPGAGQCALRGAGERRRCSPYRPALRAGRCGRGPSRPRSAAHHRPEHPGSQLSSGCVERAGDMHYHGAALTPPCGHGSLS